MTIKPHIPQRKVSTTPFSKNKFKGNYEEVKDWELELEVYVYEPQSLAELPDDATELDYRRVWEKFSDGGHINIFLVPYKESPVVKFQLTSRAANFDGISKDEAISGFTNKRIGDRPTKRFYSFKPLEVSEDEINLKDIELFEDNNLVEIINNDNTFKQTSFTLEKFEPFDGGEGSYYRDVTFFYGISKPKDVDIVEINSGKVSQLTGLISFNGIKGNKTDYEWLMRVKDNAIDPTKIEGARIRNNKIEYSETAMKKDVQFVVPQVTQNDVKWHVPWVWEYIYLNEQFEGDYKWDWLSPSGTQESDNLSPEDSDTALTGEWFNMERAYLWDSVTDTIEYWHLKDRNLFEDGKEQSYFLPYTIEFGLSWGLSSHGSTYVGSSDTGLGVGGLISNVLNNFEFTDNSFNGARAVLLDGGPWQAKATMLAVDNAYDPTIYSIGGEINMFLSNASYGAFYQSEDYKVLLGRIAEGNPTYCGTNFNSDIGILRDIEGKSVPSDIRKWNKDDDDWLMLNTPWDIKELASNYLDEPTYLDSKVSPTVNTPKIDLGGLDFDPAQLQTNASFPFFGKYIDEGKVQESTFDNEMLFKMKDRDVSQLNYSYYGFSKGTFDIVMYKEVIPEIYVEIYRKTYLNEKAQGRNLSGGTRVTWL